MKNSWGFTVENGADLDRLCAHIFGTKRGSKTKFCLLLGISTGHLHIIVKENRKVPPHLVAHIKTLQVACPEKWPEIIKNHAIDMDK